MNIFYLDNDPTICAMFHVDKHVSKMRVELAQLACTAHWITGSEAPYRKTHVNHPSAVWTRESIHNYRYVVNLGLELCKEMRLRFNTQYQKTEEVLEWLSANNPKLPNIPMTDIRLAMDNEFKISEDPVLNYRNYYRSGKIHLHKWTKRQLPYWLVDTKL